MILEYILERRRIAKLLRDFYNAPLSASSVQPILNLAEELNGDLRQRTSHQAVPDMRGDEKRV